MNNSASLSSLPSYLSLRSFIATKAGFSFSLYLAQVSRTLNILVGAALEGVIKQNTKVDNNRIFMKIIQSSFLDKALERRNHLLLLNKRKNIPDKSKKTKASK